jgi:hypothetical protein
MIILQSPITIQLPSRGSFQFKPITMTEIDYTVSYSNTQKMAVAKLHGIGRILQLWTGSDYDSMGQFTDADVDARVALLLGPDYAQGIQDLFTTPQKGISQK